jgi:diguanylate cyclase (GGDEF)-like protein
MLPDASFSFDLLAVAATVLAVAALSLAGVGLRQQRFRGFGWWVTGLALAGLGAAVGSLWHTGAGRLLASLLLMQWPLLMLVGLRRFNARRDLPAQERVDWMVLALAGILSTLAAGLPAVGGLAAGTQAALWTAAICAMALHLYTAALLFLGPPGREGTPLQAVGTVIAIGGFAPLLLALPSGNAADLLQNQALCASLGGVVMAPAMLTLVSERIQRQLRSSQRRLRVLANLDALTQVPNRRHFEELAARALHNDPPASATLLLFDIDHFKGINDRMGHPAGDRALQLVAAAVRTHLREFDLAGRHGGDEFVLLLRNADTHQAMGLAERIVSEVQKRAGGHRLPALTLSFGVVKVAAGEDLDSALHRADQALYEAKRQGRSRAVAAEGDSEQPVFSHSQPLGLCS